MKLVIYIVPLFDTYSTCLSSAFDIGWIVQFYPLDRNLEVCETLHQLFQSMGCLGFHTEEHGICRQARSLVTMTDADDGDRDTALLTLTCKREHHHGDPRGQRHEAEQEGNPPLEGSELSDVLQDLVIVQARLLPHAALAQDNYVMLSRVLPDPCKISPSPDGYLLSRAGLRCY